MKSFMTKQMLIQKLKPLLFVGLFGGLYFLVWRPIRVVVVQDLILPAISSIEQPRAQIYNTHPNNPAFYVILPNVYGPLQRNNENREKRTDSPVGMERQKNVFNYTAFGDKFFLFGSLYLLSFGFGWNRVLQLFLIHQGISLLSVICLFSAVGIHPAWLYPMNLLVTYITPAATGMFVLTTKSRR